MAARMQTTTKSIPPQEVPADSKVRVYYSESAELAIGAIKGKVVEVDGKHTRIGEKIIKFSANMGGRKGYMYDGFGIFQTDDPELIEYMDKRCAEVGDVFGPEEYRNRLKPNAERMADANRMIEDRNALIAKLQEELAARG